MSLKKRDNKQTVEERVYKKCGEPLRSTNRHNYCDNCRRERAKTRRETAELCLSVGVIALSTIPGVRHFIKER